MALTYLLYVIVVLMTEEINIHLLSDGKIARQVWDFFGNSCGIKVKHGHIKQNAMKWWISKENNEFHGFLL